MSQFLNFFFEKENNTHKQLVYNLNKDVVAQLYHSRIKIVENVKEIKNGLRRVILSNAQHIKGQQTILSGKPIDLIKIQQAEINNFERCVHILSPANVLKRGYTITMIGGKAVNTINQIREGDRLTTILADGSVESKVSDINKSKQP